MSRPVIAAAIAVVLSAGAATAQHAGHGAAAAPATAANDAGRAFTEAHERMMRDTPRPTGNADQDFVAMMIPHHQGAVDMAQAQLRYGTDPALRALAERIVADQEREIAEMRDWQRRNPR